MKAKRDIRSFEPDDDVARMLARASLDGVKLGHLVNMGLRKILTEKGYARKKDAVAA